MKQQATIKRPVARPSSLQKKLRQTVEAVHRRSRFHPSIGLILGSGLGGLTASLKLAAAIDYKELPHMVPSTAPGHAGKLVLGSLGLRKLAVMSGRFHAYEGYSMDQVSYPVRLLKALGAETLILTSIVGSMNPAMPAGSLVMLEDHINLMGMNPLIGPNEEALGPRFPDMSEPYDKALRRLALKVSQQQEIPLKEGVYAAVGGPNLETRAEYRMLRQIGADVVGMSIAPEVITARHAGLRVLAVTVVSDDCIPETLKPAVVEELLAIAAATEPKLTRLLAETIKQMD